MRLLCDDRFYSSHNQLRLNFIGSVVQSEGPMQPFGTFEVLMSIFTFLTVPIYI